MKVGMYYNNKDVRIEERPVPKIGNRDLLLEVMNCGICGSDIMEWYRIKKAPLVLGHELTGKVIQTGKEIIEYKIGDRVFATHHVPCEECNYCQTGHETACDVFQIKNNFCLGGFSQYLRVSGKSVETGILKLPEEVSYEQGTFIEPLGTVVRGLRTIGLKRGESVLILGAGVAGLLNIKLAKALGAGRIIATDVSNYRLEAARKAGAEYVINANENVPASLKEVNNGLVNKVIICTGALQAAKQALKSVDKGGTVMFFAVPKPEETLDVDFNYYWRNDISFKTTYGASPSDNKTALEYIKSRNIEVDDLITHRLDLENIALGFSLATEGDCLKVLIKTNK